MIKMIVFLGLILTNVTGGHPQVTHLETSLQETNQVSIPSIDQLKEIAVSNKYIVDETMSPSSEFQLFNPKTKGGFMAMMTDDHTLFSIDVYLSGDPSVVPVLSDVLKLYGLPVSHLNDDVAKCHDDKKDFVRNYEYYWVEYMPSENDPNVVLVRYRPFVDE